MFCPNCGKQIQDDANYCAYCGTPQKEDLTPRSTSKVQLEYCEIIGKTKDLNMPAFFGKTSCKLILVAEGIGPKGTYIVTQTEPLQRQGDFAFVFSNEDIDLKNKLNELISSLNNGGWEQIPEKGKEWYSFKFRRPVSK